MLGTASLASAQAITTIVPNGWIQDPYSAHNVDFGVVNPNTSYPNFTNNGAGLGNLNGFSPLGQKLTLTAPGQSVIASGQVIPSGNVNTASNVQFRFGLLYQGTKTGDTGWMGTLIANATANGSSGLYLENTNNTGVFANGSASTIPGLAGATFTAGWGPGTFNYLVSVTYLSSTANLVRWSIQGVSPNTYVFAGRYTNNAAATEVGVNFDSVGFLCGGSTWYSASTADGLAVTNLTVVYGNFSDGTWNSTASGLWSATGNWNNAAVANGSGFIADFSQVPLTADTTVTLDTSRTLGSLYFGATGGSLNNWFLTPSGGSTLTLSTYGLNVPAIIGVSQNTATVSPAITSTNGLTKTGAGTLVLGGNNTLAGPLNLNGGEVGFSSLANLPLSGTALSAVTFNGGGFLWEPGNTVDISALGETISFAGTGGFDTGANNVTLASGFGDGGVGGFIKRGTGTLTLGGSVAYGGTTTVSNGVLALASSGSISSSTNFVVLTGATLNVSALSGGLTLNQNLSGAGTVVGNISDSSGVTTAAGYAATGAAGTLTVTGNLSLNGGGTLNYGLASTTTAGGGVNDLIAVSGTLTIAGPTALNINLINGAPGLGTYTLFTYGSFSGNVANLTAPLGFSVVNNTAAKAIQLVVTHVPQSLTWQGDGSANVWDTDTTENWLNAGSPAYFFTGDSVTFTDTGSASPAIDIAAAVSPAAVTVNAVQSYDFTGAGIATGKLTKSNTGTLTLENNNTYTGPTVISAGTLQVGGNVIGGTSGTLGTGPVTNNGALVFDLAQNYTVTTNIAGTGSITNLGSSGAITLSGSVSGAGVYMFGQGDLVLSGSNSYTGPTIVATGTLHPENNHALGAGASSISVSNGAQLYIDIPSTITNKPLVLAGVGPTGNGALRAGGGGTTIIGGVVTLTADTQLQVDGNSTLNLTNAAGLAASGINLTVGADTSGAGNITGPLSLGAGYLIVQDAGTWNLAASNNFTGLTTINGGTLVVAGTNTLGPVSAFTPAYVTVSGGILAVSNNVTFADGLRGFTLGGTTAGFDVPAGLTLVISNQITGSGTLVKHDAGTLVLSGSNTFAGTLDVDSANNVLNDGILEITTSNAIVDVTSPIALQNNLGGASTFEVNGGPNGNITVGQDFTIAGRSPVVPDILSAAGTNTLAGNFTFTGGGGSSHYVVESDSGLLTLGSAATTLIFSTADAQTLTFQGNGNFAVAGVVSDGTAPTSIQKNGTGSLTLAAVNTYSGSTMSTGGVLNVTGTLGTGSVTATGGSLAGNGTINGPVSVAAGATFAPGVPLGTLTINSSLALAGNTLITVNGPGASSQVKGLTSVTYGGTLTVANTGGALASGNTFPLFTATSATGNFTSITPAPGSGLGWSFNPASGVLSVVTTVATNPTNITAKVTGSTLTLNWPADHQGWILQSQTNTLGKGLSGNWVDVSGSGAGTQAVINVTATNPAVFFRLRSP
jgi:autotransporter-associated beta strand protein